jgi:hypothetical protein
MALHNRSLRGAGFGPVLAAQRAYVAQSGRRSRYGLTVPEAFVRGIRDLGYRTNGDAIAELIDNALQAYAERIDVLFGYGGTASAKKPSQLAVIDNGHGMEPVMIRMAVMWGGTHRENDRGGLGRYGYGLPCSAVSLGRRFTVFSRTSGDTLCSVSLDLDALTDGDYTDAAGDIIIPEPVRDHLPDFVTQRIAASYPDGWPSGTVVLIEKLDRLEWATTQSLRQNLCRHFGVMYHKLRGEAALYVDGDFVEPIDPLFLTPEFYLHDLDDDRARPFDPVRIEVRHPDTGAYWGAITLRYAWLPPSFGSIDKARDAVGLNANARFSILKDYHGLIFSRNGRLIDVQTRTPWTTFINNDRYIRVEVEFSATLDEAFGVTTSKQQVTVSRFIWDLLAEAGVPKAIEQLRNKVKEAKFQRRFAALSPPPGEPRISERAMSLARVALENAKDSDDQGQLSLRSTPYEVRSQHAPHQPFFQTGHRRGVRVLVLNTAHRFYEEIYDGPVATPELRSALEVLLFCIGDVIADGVDGTQTLDNAQLLLWSERLDVALSMLSAHLRASDDQDVGQTMWADNLG